MLSVSINDCKRYSFEQKKDLSHWRHWTYVWYIQISFIGVLIIFFHLLVWSRRVAEPRNWWSRNTSHWISCTWWVAESMVSWIHIMPLPSLPNLHSWSKFPFAPFFSLDRFKNNGENFQIKLPGRVHQNPDVSVVENKKFSLPENLVQINAYLRWERKGRQSYTPDQEKVNFPLQSSMNHGVHFNCILHHISEFFNIAHISYGP